MFSDHRDRGQYHRLAELEETRSCCLLGQSPRFELQCAAGELLLDVLH